MLYDKKGEKIRMEAITTFEISLIKLSNFIPYLFNKNIELIKLDIEGGEEKVIVDEIELENIIFLLFSLNLIQNF